MRLKLRRQFSVLFPPMSGNVRFCPVFSTLPPLSPSNSCTNRTYSSFHHSADRTYQTFAPQPVFFAFPSRSSRLAVRFGCALRQRRQFSVLFPPMSGNVRFCPVFSTLPRLSPSTLCTNTTYSNSHPAADRTYRTSALKTVYAPADRFTGVVPE